ncbi:putative ribonuclease H-like domain-containing protein [Tanacetum coccineum]
MADDEVPTNMALMAFSDFEGSLLMPQVEELVSDDKLEKKPVFYIVAKIEFVRPKQQEKPVRKSVKYAEAHCNYHQKKRVVYGNNYTRVNYNYSAKKTHPSAHKNMAPRAFLMKTGLRSLNTARPGHPQKEDQGYVDSGCSRHMTGNMSYLSDFKEFDGGYVTFGGGAKGGKITGKGTLKTGKLDFEDVYFVKELQFNLFSVSQMCDKKNSVLFTNTGCFVLSPDFKLADKSQVLLKVPRKNNMYSVDMKNIVPKESLTCLVAKATLDESMLWHRRLGHVNFKTINKLVKENLVRGLPLKRFENDQTCVACLKGKQHKASCKSKIQNSITQPLFMLHMDLFGPTFVSSLMNKKYCLVVTDNYSRFTWVFFLASKDETSGILKSFITEIENLVDKKAEMRNRTLIKAARTMLADSKLPTTFWAEAINTACYVQNRVLVVKPQNNTPYELFRVEPKKVIQALTNPSWIEAMQDKLLQFKLQKVWTLVDLPYGKRAIGTKWVYRNKKDERGIVVRNKARLVAQGYTQEEGIDYDEVFAPVARIEAIRLFLAYASFMNFVVYQMDVKSAFLYGKIEEEVYVCQPLGFEDPEFPDRFYKVEKALYGLHQAPKAWYETLSTYLLDNGFQRGQIDKTLFIKGDILLVQVMQKEDGIFISQDKYVDGILKKFGFSTMKTTSTPMETSKPLIKDENAKDVDVHLYRSMIGSLMYLTSSRPDIMFVDSPFDLEAYTDSDYAGASLDRKSTTRGCQFLRSRLISWQCKKQTIVANSTTKAEYVADVLLLDMKAKRTTEISQSSGSIPLIADETVIKEWEDRMERAATTTSSLEAEQDNGNINRTQSMATLKESFPQGTGSGSGPRRLTRHESMVPQPGSPTQTNVADDVASIGVDVRLGGATTTVTSLEAGHGSGNIDKTPTMPHDSPLLRVHTLRSDVDRMQHNELMDLVIKLSDKVVALEADLKQTKQIYGVAFTKLIKKVKTLEKTVKSSQARRKARIVVSDDEEDLEDPSKQGRKIAKINEDPNISLVQHDAEVQGRHEHDMEPDFEFTTAEEVYTAKKEVSTAKLVSTAGASVSTTSSTKDKGKAIMEESSEPIQTKIKLQLEQERLGYKEAMRLQAKIDKEERQRIARVQKEAISFNIEEWDGIQARIEADEEFAQRLQSEEREMYTVAEKARLLAEFINERKRWLDELVQEKSKRQKTTGKLRTAEEITCSTGIPFDHRHTWRFPSYRLAFILYLEGFLLSVSDLPGAVWQDEQSVEQTSNGLRPLRLLGVHSSDSLDAFSRWQLRTASAFSGHAFQPLLCLPLSPTKHSFCIRQVQLLGVQFHVYIRWVLYCFCYVSNDFLSVRLYNQVSNYTSSLRHLPLECLITNR